MKHEHRSLILLFISLLTINDIYAQKSNTIEAKAARIHQSAFTVDSHTDAPLNFLNKNYDISKDNSKTLTRTCVDFPRMRQGGLDAAFFAVFIGQGPRTDRKAHV